MRFCGSALDKYWQDSHAQRCQKVIIGASQTYSELFWFLTRRNLRTRHIPPYLSAWLKEKKGAWIHCWAAVERYWQCCCAKQPCNSLCSQLLTQDERWGGKSYFHQIKASARTVELCKLNAFHNCAVPEAFIFLLRCHPFLKKTRTAVCTVGNDQHVEKERGDF